jgi:hypothetical protein
MFLSNKNIFTAELLYARRFIIHVDTFDVAFHLSQEKLSNSSLGLGALSHRLATVSFN